MVALLKEPLQTMSCGKLSVIIVKFSPPSEMSITRQVFEREYNYCHLNA